MAHQKLSLYQSMILILVSVCAPLGNACLAKGMTSLPELSLAHPFSLFAAVFTPWVGLGIALLIGFFELLSHFCLHEQVSFQRWLGVALITLGVAFVAPGPSRTVRPALSDSAPLETLVEKGAPQ